MAQPDDITEDEKETKNDNEAVNDFYDKIAEEAMKLNENSGPSEKDSSAIIASIVKKLKAKNPLPEGASEEPLYEMARKIFWTWEDEQRAKKKNGKEEFLDGSPVAIMEG